MTLGSLLKRTNSQAPLLGQLNENLGTVQGVDGFQKLEGVLMCMHSYEHLDRGGSGTEANTPILEKKTPFSPAVLPDKHLVL